MEGVRNKKVMRVLREQVRKNGEIIAELMKQVIIIEGEKARKRRMKQDRKQVRRDYNEKWEEEEQKRRKEDNR